MKEVRVLKPDEHIPHDMLKVGNILAVSVGTGGLIGRITKVVPDGQIELSTLAAPNEQSTKRLFKDYAELDHIKPCYLAELTPAEEAALTPVVADAWYQEVETGRVVKATTNGWQDAAGKTELMPVLPRMVLRWSPPSPDATPLVVPPLADPAVAPYVDEEEDTDPEPEYDGGDDD